MKNKFIRNKYINIPISQAAFIMIAYGGHKELYYGMNSEIIKQLVKNEYNHLKPYELFDLGLKVFRKDHDEFHFKNGHKSSVTAIVAENKGVSIKFGRPKFGEDPAKLFFVLKLGKKRIL